MVIFCKKILIFGRLFEFDCELSVLLFLETCCFVCSIKMVELGGAESFLLDLETNGRIEYNSTIGKYETILKILYY